MSNLQTTLNGEFTLKGKGLHTGVDVKVVFMPAEADHGFKFKRIDLENQPVIDALAENVISTARSTEIGKGDVRVSTIEHALSALTAMGVDNCLIEIDGPEVPIFDGNASIYVENIKKTGIKELEARVKYFQPTEKLEYVDEETGAKITILPDDKFSVCTMLAFEGSNVLGNQFAVMENLSEYETEIASCKTFVFLHELEPLLNTNLVKGGSLDNALVVVDKKVSQAELDRVAELFSHPKVDVIGKGYLSNTELKFENEPARHKILDVIGDLALIGKRIKGRVIAFKPGHKTNTTFAKSIRRTLKRNPDQPPVFDINAEPLMGVGEIKRLIPHRPPFLLIDKIIDIEENNIVGVKNITMNEAFFMGHFPDEPVMPGVLIVEAMAQTLGILVLNSLDEPERYSTYFLKIDNVKFRRKVVPGDTLVFDLELTTPIRRGVASARGLAYVGNQVVTEAEFMAQIVKNK